MMRIRRMVVATLLAGIVLSGCGNSKVDEMIENQNEKESISISTPSENMATENLKSDTNQEDDIKVSIKDNQTVSANQGDIADNQNNNVLETANSQNSNIVGIDLDLTTMSSTMVYSEVYNIMCYPDDYRDKCIKMNGTCSIFEDVVTGQLYYACIIQDATQCCQQGIEFNLQDSYKYPDDYPENGEEVTVVGIFETYAEDGVLYCRLRDAVLCQ